MRCSTLGALRILILLSLAVNLAGCSPSDTPGSTGEAIGVLTLGVLPDEAPARQRRKYAPLIEAIRSKTGLDARLQLPTSYAKLVESFSNAEVDIAYFGGYTFARAHELYGAVPLVMRDIDARFVSYVVVRSNDKARELRDLAGRSFAFGSRLSTSGHIMPRYYFDQLGIHPESHFSEVRYSGAHDRTIQWVIDDAVDAGVANGQIVEQFLDSGHEDRASLKVIWQTRPYVDYVWAAQPSMSQKTRHAVMDAFLSMSKDASPGREFLSDVGAGFFVPASIDDFDELRGAIEAVDRALDSDS